MLKIIGVPMAGDLLHAQRRGADSAGNTVRVGRRAASRASFMVVIGPINETAASELTPDRLWVWGWLPPTNPVVLLWLLHSVLALAD